MISEGDPARQLSRLIWDTLDSPGDADTPALLRAASAYLDAAKGGNPDLLALSRAMAYDALDHAFLQSEDALAELRLSARAFGMASRALPRHLQTSG